MATYFIRQNGSDSNAGTSAGTAWRTFGKALGASGMASGDTCYVGAGIYREIVTVSMTAAAATTKLIGDLDGSQTGDAGEVILSAQTSGDLAAPSSSSLVTASGKPWLWFENVTFVGGATTYACFNLQSAAGSNNWTFRRCVFYGGSPSGRTAVGWWGQASTAANWTIDSCLAINCTLIEIQTVVNATADHDINFVVKNSVSLLGPLVSVVSGGGTGTFHMGGVIVTNGTALNGGVVAAASTLSTSIPMQVKNCLIYSSGFGMSGGTSGQIIEDYNLLYAATARTNVTAGAHSFATASGWPGLDIGQSWLYGFAPRPFFSPTRYFPFVGAGNDATYGQTTDSLARPRPGNGTVFGASGTASSGTTTALTDSGKAWGVDQWKDWLVKITGGTGSGQIKRISSNTATALTISGAAPAGGLWATTPDATSTYQIYRGPRSETGKATAGTTTTLTDSGANWGTTQWVGYTVSLTGGTGSGQTATITSHTATTLTFAAVGTAPDATTTYSIYLSTSVDQTQNAAGAFERHDDARQETTTVDASGSAIRIEGPGDQQFAIPVDATSTTISVKLRYDSAYGGTNKPTATLLAAPQIGVTAETKTMTLAANNWETLTFTTQTPTAKGVVLVRIAATPDKATGVCFADTFSIS